MTMSAGCDKLGVKWTEVAEVRSHHRMSLCPGERDDLRISERLPILALLDRNRIVTACSQFGSDERREHLVE